MTLRWRPGYDNGAIYTPGKLTLRKTWQPMDADAAAYITAVEAADGQALEEKTKIAIDNFVLGCKADGIWSAIKASCILAGARTLSGALQPLVGAAPTNNNFVSGDYNRKTGLVGNGSTKYLNSNRAGNADPQDNAHISCFVSSVQSGASGRALLGVITTGPTNRIYQLAIDNGQDICAMRSSAILPSNRPNNNFATGFQGGARSSSASFFYQYSGTQLTLSSSSIAPSSAQVFIFAQNLNGSLSVPTDARLAFYSIGESLNLALLDVRVTDLINAFAAAIP